MEKKLADIFKEYFNTGEEQLADDLLLENLEDWDSLRHMDLIVAIEKEFELELTPKEIISIKTFGDIKNLLTQKGIKSNEN